MGLARDPDGKVVLEDLWMDVCLQPMDVFNVYLGQAGACVADLVHNRTLPSRSSPLLGGKEKQRQEFDPL